MDVFEWSSISRPAGRWTYAAFIMSGRMLSRIQNRSHTDLEWRFGDIYPNFVTITGTSFVLAYSRGRTATIAVMLFRLRHEAPSKVRLVRYQLADKSFMISQDSRVFSP